jgi:hypothetical protein
VTDDRDSIYQKKTPEIGLQRQGLTVPFMPEIPHAPLAERLLL